MASGDSNVNILVSRRRKSGGNWNHAGKMRTRFVCNPSKCEAANPPRLAQVARPRIDKRVATAERRVLPQSDAHQTPSTKAIIRTDAIGQIISGGSATRPTFTWASVRHARTNGSTTPTSKAVVQAADNFNSHCLRAETGSVKCHAARPSVFSSPKATQGVNNTTIGT